MKTKVISVRKNFLKKDLCFAKNLIEKGEIIAFPTETVYGLGACLHLQEAIQKIYAVKNRPSDNPLIVHVADSRWVEDLAIDLPSHYFNLLESFFPGSLTLILKKREGIPPLSLPTIAIRMPNHPIALQLLEAVGRPMVAPSANLSTKPSPTNASHVLEDLDGKIPLILDGGNTDLGLESTILSLVEDKPKILRPGSVSKRDLEKSLGIKIETSRVSSICYPGMKYRHYAPVAKVVLFDSEEKILKEKLLSRFVFSFQKKLNCANAFSFEGKSLYFLFRKADQEKVQEIHILIDPQLAQEEALMNRIQKAASSI